MKLSPIYTARLEEREQIGLQKGLRQGIQQEATILIVRLLKKKVGELSPSLESQVMALPIDILENLGEDLLDFNSIDDLTNWLNNHQ